MRRPGPHYGGEGESPPRVRLRGCGAAGGAAWEHVTLRGPGARCSGAAAGGAAAAQAQCSCFPDPKVLVGRHLGSRLPFLAARGLAFGSPQSWTLGHGNRSPALAPESVF